MKLRIRLLALSTLLVTFSNFNFSFPTLAANPTTSPKCSKTPNFREEFANYKETELSDRYASGVIVQRLISTGLLNIDKPTPNDFYGVKNFQQLYKILEQGVLVANTIDNPRYKADSLTVLAAFYRAATENHRFKYPLSLSSNLNYSENLSRDLAEIQKLKKAFDIQSLNLLHQSFQVTQAIKEPKEKIKILGKIASIYATLEQSEKAAQILTQIVEITNMIEDRNQRSIALYGVVENYVDPSRILEMLSQSMTTQLYDFQEKPEQRINRLTNALEIANKIEVNDYKFNVLAKIANKYATVKQYDQALQVARNIEDISLKSEVLAQIVQSNAEVRLDWERSVNQNFRIAGIETEPESNNELLTKVFQVINAVKDVHSKDIILGEVACGYVDASKNIAVSIDFYENKWVTAFADASALIDQALIIANNIQNPDIKSKTLALMAFKVSDSLSRFIGGSEAKKQLVKQLQNRSLTIAHNIPDSEIKYKTLGVIAFNTATSSIELSQPITTNKKSVKGLDGEIFTIVDQIKNNDIKSEVLAEIALDFTEERYTGSMLKKYSQALEIVNNIQLISITNRTLSKIAENYVNRIRNSKQKTEEKDEYLELLSQALQIAKNPTYEKALRPMIADLYLEVGEIDRAFQLVNVMNYHEIKFKLLAKVATQKSIAGETQTADNIFAQILQIAETKKNAYQKASALYTIATAYRNSERYEEASKIITQASFLVKNIQNIPLTKTSKNPDNIFTIFYPSFKNLLSRNNSNQNFIDVDIQNLLFQIDRFISELNLSGEYQPAKQYNHNLQSLIAQSKYEEALELVQQSRARVLVDLMNRPSSLLSYTLEYFEQLKAHPTPPPPKIDQIRKIAKERQATLVEYAIVYRDNQSQNVTQNSESELFIWVVKPTGEVAFRRVNLSFFSQENIWLAQLASNPQLFVRGLMQELNVNVQKIHPVFITIIILSLGSIIGIVILYLRLLFSRKAPLNRLVNFPKIGRNKEKNLSKKEVKFFYSYTCKENLSFRKIWQPLLLALVLAGGGGVFLFANIFQQKIVANQHQRIASRDKPLPQNQNQNQHNNNQADNSLLAHLIFDSRESMGVRGRGLGLVPKVEKTKQTSRLQQLHKLLIEPIADLLPTDASKPVIFIPTKSLFFVPFPALQDPDGKYLIEKHTILTAPSIQVLDLAQKRRQKIQQSTNQGILVVGNPTMPVLVSADGKPPEQLPPLPGAEQEARAIASLLNTKPIIGSNATEPVVMSLMLKARIIHIATHGLLDPIYKWKESPGAIALAPLQDNSTISLRDLQVPYPPSMPNNELIDGFFMLDNYFSVPPLNAELVVLSACDTGRGKLTEDGVVGLSRSFITAGIPSLIVSLWAIPDAPTTFLMTEFYRNWQQTGNKAQALRQAMLTTMKQHPDPRNWAAFTLIGEAK